MHFCRPGIPQRPACTCNDSHHQQRIPREPERSRHGRHNPCSEFEVGGGVEPDCPTKLRRQTRPTQLWCPASTISSLPSALPAPSEQPSAHSLTPRRDSSPMCSRHRSCPQLNSVHGQRARRPTPQPRNPLTMPGEKCLASHQRRPKRPPRPDHGKSCGRNTPVAARSGS
jgi:hypothetical protein